MSWKVIIINTRGERGERARLSWGKASRIALNVYTFSLFIGYLDFITRDKARREEESGVGLVAFREKVTVSGGGGLVFDEFREKGGNLVRGQGCLDGRLDNNGS